MKTNLTKLLMLAILATFAFAACDDDDNEPSKLIIKMGAQTNTSVGGFYSISENKVYTQADAFNNQDKIDLLCFYEHNEETQKINDISLASPGSKITGIFTGTTAVDNWTTKDTTFFCETTLTVEAFDAIKDGDATIPASFNEDNSYKKAKLLEVNDVWAFKTKKTNIYGLFKVRSVVQGADGSVEFELKLKKPATAR
jgi:hypothetical protein